MFTSLVRVTLILCSLFHHNCLGINDSKELSKDLGMTPQAMIEHRAHPRINTTSGLLIGTTLEQAHAFYSVPYAEEPIRYMPPVAVAYRGQLNVSQPDFVLCHQSYEQCLDGVCDRNYQDDCLVLNIHVPSSVNLNQVQSSDLLPVMVWIHGGGFFIGSGSQSDLDGRFLSNSTNTIVVTFNYRLDALGFLVYEDSDVKYEGNQGFKDQQLALKWVQDNIHKFGGNNDKVTIFGNSAGAQSVMLHLLSDVSDPLFNRAIMESCAAVTKYPTPDEAKKIVDLLYKAVGCKGSTLDCLTKTGPGDIVNALDTVKDLALESLTFFDYFEPYRPVIDGVEFTDQPLNLFRDGKWQKNKEVIIGSTTDEAVYLYAKYKDGLNETAFRKFHKLMLGSHYGSIIADHYVNISRGSNLNHDSNLNFNKMLYKEVTDFYHTCPERALARFMSQTSSQPNPPIYLYAYAHNPSSPDCEVVNPRTGPGLCNYSYHASEILFVFNTGSLIEYNNSPDDEIVIDILSRFWGKFVHSGSPSEDSREWPRYVDYPQAGDISSWSNARIDSPASSVESDYRKDVCDFWDSTGYYVNFTLFSSTTQSTVDSTTSSAGNMFLSEMLVALIVIKLMVYRNQTH